MPREVRQWLIIAAIVGSMMLGFWVAGVKPAKHGTSSDGMPTTIGQ